MENKHYLNSLFLSLGVNAKEFSESLGFNRADRIYNILNSKNNVSSDLARIIIGKYPNVDYNWLLTGEGEMLNGKNINQIGSISNSTVVAPNMSGNGTVNYNNLKIEDMVKIMEERFHHMLEKEAQVKEVFEENRKLTDEVIRQNAEFRNYNAAYRRQAEKIAELTDKLLEKNSVGKP